MFPMDKLLDVVTNSVGRISKHFFDRIDIDTEAYKIEKIAEARAEELKIMSAAIKETVHLTGGIEYKDNNIFISSPKVISIDSNSQVVLSSPIIERRIEERVKFQEVKRQSNIENITAFAAEELKNRHF